MVDVTKNVRKKKESREEGRDQEWKRQEKKELKIFPSFFFCLSLKKDTFWRNFSGNFRGGNGKSSRISIVPDVFVFLLPRAFCGETLLGVILRSM